MKSMKILATLAAATIGYLPATAAEYAISQIGGLPGSSGTQEANGINNGGQVVGRSGTRGWVWSGPGTMTALPHGDGFISGSSATDINENGQIGGYVYIEGASYAFRYTPGPGYQFLASLGNSGSIGYSLNDSGTVVGFSWNSLNVLGTLWKPGEAPEFLPFYEPTSRSLGQSINNAGFVSGYSTLNGVRRAVVFSPHGTVADLHNALPGDATDSQADAINEIGWGVGSYVGADDLRHSFHYRGLGVTTIPDAAGFNFSRLTALNRFVSGVGFVQRGVGGTKSAAVYHVNQTMLDLNTLIEPNSGWHLTEATGINDNGWIVGNGTFQGVETTFLLQPVPEPASLAVFGLGALAYRFRRRSAR